MLVLLVLFVLVLAEKVGCDRAADCAERAVSGFVTEIPACDTAEHRLSDTAFALGAA